MYSHGHGASQHHRHGIWTLKIRSYVNGLKATSFTLPCSKLQSILQIYSPSTWVIHCLPNMLIMSLVMFCHTMPHYDWPHPSYIIMGLLPHCTQLSQSFSPLQRCGILSPITRLLLSGPCLVSASFQHLPPTHFSWSNSDSLFGLWGGTVQ